MTATTTKSIFWKGVRDGAPFLLVVGPFGLLFGVIATEAGLNLSETMGFSVLVIAGAAQFTAVQLMVDEAPTLIVLATSLAVNLRMAMYSASITPHLGAAPLWKRALVSYFLVDQSYAVSVAKYEKENWSLQQKLAYFFGVIIPICPMWYVLTLVGAMVGETIPDTWALDFAIPITFLALVAPALRTLPHVIAAFVSIVLALLLAGLPYNSGLLIAAVVAMMIGAQSELMIGRRK
ncbi:AzlC family ABC transporter permease [Parasulfitobacter algicola]|uniref:AzlC family ABC transporter permease n=1 Tax=Parasulfitobacter algicola TaxID=2614809 RepID=A0ABX2ILR5_9RHOB|nr:AzlC family ABC transporter permease [Sulfitobacter algicola]NSX53822.1 AzlC family ABC transporter permease [Sulfitobacter algicola]